MAEHYCFPDVPVLALSTLGLENSVKNKNIGPYKDWTQMFSEGCLQVNEQIIQPICPHSGITTHRQERLVHLAAGEKAEVMRK